MRKGASPLLNGVFLRVCSNGRCIQEPVRCNKTRRVLAFSNVTSVLCLRSILIVSRRSLSKACPIKTLFESTLLIHQGICDTFVVC